ncbi:MAG: AMP-binding protein, partial [Acidimicrobiia bacterium]
MADGQWLNIADRFLVDRLAEGRGGRVALRLGDREYTYEEVDRLANRIGHALLARDVRPEERVIIALPDGAEYAAALFGILKVGAVAVMVNPGLAAEGMAAMVDLARARVAVFDPSGAVPVAQPLVAGPGDGESLDHPDTLTTVRTHRDDPAIWLFTGGTTGLPKAAVQTHGSFANTTR